MLAALLCAVPGAQAQDSIAVTQPADAALTRYGVRGPASEQLAFQGALNYDKAGGGADAMLYAAPGLAGFLVAVAVHGAINSAVRENEKKRLREEADKVLLPYLDAIKAYPQAQLLQGALPAMRSRGEKRVLASTMLAFVDETAVDVTPQFAMTQDQSALILDNAISLKSMSRSTPYLKIIRVVSPVRSGAEPPLLWLDDGGRQLRAETARMLALSLDIALDDAAKSTGADSTPFKTVRYPEGRVERMERAQIVSTTCEHLILRTLRGELMAVPRKPTEVQPCGIEAASATALSTP